jgi:hypothetical protein
MEALRGLDARRSAAGAQSAVTSMHPIVTSTEDLETAGS